MQQTSFAGTFSLGRLVILGNRRAEREKIGNFFGGGERKGVSGTRAGERLPLGVPRGPLGGWVDIYSKAKQEIYILEANHLRTVRPEKTFLSILPPQKYIVTNGGLTGCLKPTSVHPVQKSAVPRTWPCKAMPPRSSSNPDQGT
uniref:Uncharacterized protein n=1 Tax=Micrurus surinamensis TaxID=129470 RepID=A0A2D4Q5P2_MICSU